MINQYIRPTTKVSAAIKLLQDSPHEFALCGSRFFGNTHTDSDWDFWAEYNTQVTHWLVVNGFKELEKGEGHSELYADIEGGETVAIYRHPSGVDVSLQKSLLLAKRARFLIQSFIPNYAQLPHEQRSGILIAVKGALRENGPTDYWSYRPQEAYDNSNDLL